MTHCSSSTDISLVILAAGLGLRFGGDKPLAEVGDSGNPLMHYSVMDAWRAGIRRLVLVINPVMEDAVRKKFLPGLPDDLEVDLVHQLATDLPGSCSAVSREKPWGTGHALWCARAAATGPVIVINADDYYGRDAIERLAHHFEISDSWAMASYPLEQTLSGSGAVNRGLCEVNAGYLKGVRECLSIRSDAGRISGELSGEPVPLSPGLPVSMNIWGFGPEVFGHLRQGLERFLAGSSTDKRAEYYLPDMVSQVLQAGAARVRVYPSRDEWFGITYREDLVRLEPLMRSLSGRSE